MLSSFDDYPIHQTSYPVVRTGSSDLNHYDRYFFNGYTDDANTFFAVALGLYPNRHVADAHVSVVLDGTTIDARQINVHASRRAPLDRAEANRVGPITVDVVQPLRVLRITVDAPEHGMRADLTFVGRASVIEEPHFFHQVGQRVVMDSTRLTQFGRWEGWLEIDGERRDLGPDRTRGTRDRSWGIRPVGEPAPTGAPVADPQFFWLWAPISFGSFCTHFDVNELFDGHRWHASGFVSTDDDTAEQAAHAMRLVDYRLEWEPGTRRASWCEIDLEPWQGEPSTVRLEPVYDFYMKGIGYTHPAWRHGCWKGELVVEGDRWDLPIDDPTAIENLHVQTIVEATTRGGVGEHTGLGILEQLAIGRHDPSGLTGISDGFGAA